MTDNEITQLLMQANDQATNLAVTRAIRSIFKRHPSWTLVNIEKRYRNIEGSRVFLIATPQPFPSKTIALHLQSHEPAKYWLQVVVDGEIEARRVLAARGLTAEQNLMSFRIQDF